MGHYVRSLMNLKYIWEEILLSSTIVSQITTDKFYEATSFSLYLTVIEDNCVNFIENREKSISYVHQAILLAVRRNITHT